MMRFLCQLRCAELRQLPWGHRDDIAIDNLENPIEDYYREFMLGGREQEKDIL